MTFDWLCKQYLMEITSGSAAVPDLQKSIYNLFSLGYEKEMPPKKRFDRVYKALYGIYAAINNSGLNSIPLKYVTQSLNAFNAFSSNDEEDYMIFVEEFYGVDDFDGDPDIPPSIFFKLMGSLYDQNLISPKVKQLIQKEFDVDIDTEYGTVEKARSKWEEKLKQGKKDLKKKGIKDPGYSGPFPPGVPGHPGYAGDMDN